MRVNEIFYSIQGEGTHTGMPAVFLRLTGCNLQCPFCDTNQSAFTEMTEEEILHEVSLYPSRNIIITGGEPTLQLTASILHALHEVGFTIHLETNGTLPLPQGAEVDWITCSPKGEIKLRRYDELKVLYWGQDVTPYETLPAREHRLQPLDTGDDNRNEEITRQTLDYILKHPIWKLSLQTHKMLKVR